MADRYWVGGTGTWDASTTTNWATTSGGAGGASAPTSADNAYFDGNSDSGAPFTVTLGTGAVCADVIIGDGSTVTVLDQTMTLAGADSVTWSIYGSLFFPATSLTRTFVGRTLFAATTTGHTVTTNGITFTRTSNFVPAVQFDGVGGGWTLGSAITVTGLTFFTVSNGSFDTGNYNLTSVYFSFPGGSLTLGSSTISTNGTIPMVFGAGVVASAGTSVISFTGASSSGINGGGNTLNRVQFTFGSSGNTVSISNCVADTVYIAPGLNSVNISAGNTIDKLVIPATTLVRGAIRLGGDLTVTGTMHVQSGYGATFNITDTAGAITAATVNVGGEGYNVGDVLNVTGGNGDAQLTVATLSGTAIATVTISTPGTGYTTATGVATTLATSGLNPNRRVPIQSDTIGTARTITAAALNVVGADFRNITGAGAATWSDSGRTQYWGDCLGNSGITFSAGVSKYRIGTGNWSATQWAASSGGSPAVGDFPLAQDTCVFDANTTTGTHTLDSSYHIGVLNMSALTSAVTLNVVTGLLPVFYGNVTLDADVTLTGTSNITFSGQGTTQTITSAGRTFTQPLTVNSPSGTVTLADALTTSLTFSLTAGALDLGNQVLTCSNFASSNSNVRSIAFGTGKIVVTSNSTTLLDMAVATNFTFSGSGLIESNYSGSTGTRTFSFGTSGHTEANVLSLAILAGSDSISLASGAFFGNCNFTGFSGTLNNAGGGNNFYGDVTFSSSMNIPGGGGSISFRKTSGTQTVTSNGVTLNTTIEKIGAGSLQLADNLDLSASRGLLLTSGTVNLNSRTLTAGTFSSSNSNTRAIAFGTGGGITLSGSGTVFNATTGTNLTTTGTGTIDLTSASTKTFAGGGRTYPTLNQGGSGTLLITGANTFADITNTVQPTTITFPSGVTTSVQDFSVGGTLGNLVTLNASTPGTRAILNRV